MINFSLDIAIVIVLGGLIVNIDDLCVYKKANNISNTFITFTGPFSQGIIVELGSAIKQYISAKEKNKSKTYDVFSVFIEQAQNINEYLHSKKDNPSIYKKLFNSGIITIDEVDNHYAVTSGNLVEKSDVDILKTKLDKLNQLDYSEIKNLHKEILKKPLADKGLGLVEMIRKSKSNLVFSFTEIDKEYSFFQLEVQI